MNKVKLCAVIYLIAAIFGYINAIMQFMDPEGTSGVWWLLIAFVMTGLSAFYFLKRGR